MPQPIEFEIYGVNGLTHRRYLRFLEVRGPFCKDIGVQRNVRFQVLKAASFVTKLIEVRLEIFLQSLRVLNKTISANKGSDCVSEIPFDIERSLARFSSSSRAKGPERSFCPSRSAISVKKFLAASTDSAVFSSVENVASRMAKNSSQLRSLHPVNGWNGA